MLLMSNLMGGQIGLECLSLWREFINGQMFIKCIPAESRALPFTLHNNLSTGLTSYPQGVGVTSQAKNDHPRVLSLTAGIHILPHKKFALK